MAYEINQDQWSPSDSEAVVLKRMGISVWDARKLMEGSGFEFRYVDPDIHPRPGKGAADGLIFGHKHTHDKLFSWFAKQLADPVFEPSLVDPKPLEPSAPKGESAYNRRSSGESWSAIGPNSLQYAKAYAKSRGLVWPIG